MAVQLVGPAPTPHDALGGRQASAGYGPAQPSEGRYDLPVMRCSCRELKPLSVASALGVRVNASLPCVRVDQTHAV